MNFEIIDNILKIKMDSVGTLALAVLLLILGYFLRGKISFFEKFCIPAPVIGGLLFAIFNLVFWKTNIVNFELDTTFQSPFMIAFFTTVGLGASISLLKKGGKLLIIYWLLSGALGLIQNLIGVGLAKVTGIAPIYGLMAGAISMVGGHGAATSFGETAESLGFNGALVLAIAAATFGLVSGGLLGGPVAKRLITKHNLTPSPDNYEKTQDKTENSVKTEATTKTIMKQIALISACMTVGTVVGSLFSKTFDLVLPGYVGAMFVAVIVRNINEKLKFMNIDTRFVDKFGDVSLGIFLSMALMSLKLWELMDLAIPMVIILVAQVTFIVCYVFFVVFPLLGKDFDAAVMCAGMLGSGLGATPNAMANMGSVTEKFGPSKRAYMIVPIVGAFLIDIITLPGIVWFVNMFSKQ